MNDTICPVCGGPAKHDPEQEGTIYCKNPECSFMGMLPEDWL